MVKWQIAGYFPFYQTRPSKWRNTTISTWPRPDSEESRCELMLLSVKALSIIFFFHGEGSHRHGIKADNRLYINRTPVSECGNTDMPTR